MPVIESNSEHTKRCDHSGEQYPRGASGFDAGNGFFSLCALVTRRDTICSIAFV